MFSLAWQYCNPVFGYRCTSQREVHLIQKGAESWCVNVWWGELRTVGVSDLAQCLVSVLYSPKESPTCLDSSVVFLPWGLLIISQGRSNSRSLVLWTLIPGLGSDSPPPSSTLFCLSGNIRFILKPLSFICPILLFWLDYETVTATVKGEVQLWEYVLVHFLFLCHLPNLGTGSLGCSVFTPSICFINSSTIIPLLLITPVLADFKWVSWRMEALL